MPRSISWQPQLNKIHRRVSESRRTPYTRSDLESLFDVGTAAATKLLQLMPRVQQGNAAVVEREELLQWLNQAIDAEDLSAHLAALKKSPPPSSRRRVKLFQPWDAKLGRCNRMESYRIWLQKGALEMTFTTRDDFLSKWLILGQLAAEDPSFEYRYCDPPPVQERTQTQREKDLSFDKLYFKYSGQFTEAVLEGAKSSAASDRKLRGELMKKALSAYASLKELCDTHGAEMDECYINAHAKLTESFDSATDAASSVDSVPATQTELPASTPPPVAVPSQPLGHADRSASSPGPYDQATSTP